MRKKEKNNEKKLQKNLKKKPKNMKYHVESEEDAMIGTGDVWVVFAVGAATVIVLLVMVAGAFWFGFQVGREAATGVPHGFFGPKKGEAYQAPAPDGGAEALKLLDGTIARALGDIGTGRMSGSNLLDPELAGLAPTQGRTGGDL